ncbi:MAG: hypothetical protein GOVbin630_182 [Prokaryotic dsDNA virus sp.]|nr:MAG: hypothetical protein GOVbin630_182 [Prokaryotic dsDNA virus sp.]|tara:strand:- start:105 stop:320 length:216 start_codon:yes stop_codon:yes gene_type:complete
MTSDELKEVLETMDIPEKRRSITPFNVRWLLRNIGINNGSHPRLEEARECLKKLNKEYGCPNPGCYCGACQ